GAPGAPKMSEKLVAPLAMGILSNLRKNVTINGSLEHAVEIPPGQCVRSEGLLTFEKVSGRCTNKVRFTATSASGDAVTGPALEAMFRTSGYSNDFAAAGGESLEYTVPSAVSLVGTASTSSRTVSCDPSGGSDADAEPEPPPLGQPNESSAADPASGSAADEPYVGSGLAALAAALALAALALGAACFALLLRRRSRRRGGAAGAEAPPPGEALEARLAAAGHRAGCRAEAPAEEAAGAAAGVPPQVIPSLTVLDEFEEANAPRLPWAGRGKDADDDDLTVGHAQRVENVVNERRPGRGCGDSFLCCRAPEVTV
ncbi:unnamed protein product, partial [Prorocentrum cordatum]